MLFQVLDNKIECAAVYLEGELYYEQVPAGLSRTWGYASYLGEDVEYASLYCGGKTLEEVCPEHLKDRHEEINTKLKSFLISFSESKIDLTKNCFFDLVPERFLKEHCEIKNKITQHVFDNYEKPKNYQFLLELTRVLDKINKKQLNVNLKQASKHMVTEKGRRFYKKITKVSHNICYDIFATKTGRLTTKKNSFPILTLDKEYRAALEPNNDLFVELDYNAAELRMLLALLNQHQPQEDIHAWNAKNVYRGLVTREGAKKRIFAWLYNPNSKDFLSNNTYKRDEVVKKYWNGRSVNTNFNRCIESDRHHALNYIIQSSTNDLFLRKMIELDHFLKDKKSYIAFSIHDSLVIDFAKEEQDMISEITKIFSGTNFGDFKVNLSIGKNFGEMRKIKWEQ
jgi:predicted transcriptional regulator